MDTTISIGTLFTFLHHLLLVILVICLMKKRVEWTCYVCYIKYNIAWKLLKLLYIFLICVLALNTGVHLSWIISNPFRAILLLLICIPPWSKNSFNNYIFVVNIWHCDKHYTWSIIIVDTCNKWNNYLKVRFLIPF